MGFSMGFRVECEETHDVERGKPLTPAPPPSEGGEEEAANGSWAQGAFMWWRFSFSMHRGSGIRHVERGKPPYGGGYGVHGRDCGPTGVGEYL